MNRAFLRTILASVLLGGGFTALPLQWAAAQDAGAMQISWEVRNRFRLFREERDFLLHVEWRFTKLDNETRYNSGVFVRNSLDGKIWHQAQAGLAGGWLFGVTPVNGAPQRINLRPEMKENRVKPAGEWNVYDIRCQGKTISLTVNGAVTSEFTACEVPKGYIGLEAEGYRIEFRNLKLTVSP